MLLDMRKQLDNFFEKKLTFRKLGLNDNCVEFIHEIEYCHEHSNLFPVVLLSDKGDCVEIVKINNLTKFKFLIFKRNKEA